METYHKIAVVSLFLLTIFFGLFRLSESPSLVFDEGWYFQTSANLATAGVDGLQMVPGEIKHISTFVTVGYPLIYPLALWFKIFSVGVFQGRFFMFLCILAFVGAGYLLSKKMYGSSLALASLALLSTFPPLYGNGKSVMGEVPGLIFLVLFLIALNSIAVSGPRRVLRLILAGLFAGLCVATKPIYILLVPAVVLGVLIDWKRKDVSFKEVSLIAVCAFVPILVWFIVQFRLGDSLTETLNYYANPYSIGNIFEIILGNLKKLFTDVGTLYTVFLMAIWTAALGLRIWAKKKILVVEIVAYTFSVLIVLAFLRTAGFYRYLFPAQAIALIFFPYSAKYISDFIAQRLPRLNSKKIFATGILALSVLGVYQLSFDSWVAEAYSSKKTAFWQEYFAKVPDSVSYYFYQAPEVVPFIQSRNYYQHLVLFDRSLGSESLPALTSGKVDKVIVPTNYLEENKNGVFNLYVEEEKAYKYSILKKR